QVRLRSTDERLEHRKRAARIVLLQMCVGEFDRRRGNEDAVGMAIGEVVQQWIGFCAATGLDSRLRAKIVGVVIQRRPGTLRQSEVRERVRVAVVERIGVPKGYIRRSGWLAGMGLRIVENSSIGCDRARRRKLLRHRPKLLRGMKSTHELNAARRRRWSMQRMCQTRVRGS